MIECAADCPCPCHGDDENPGPHIEECAYGNPDHGEVPWRTGPGSVATVEMIDHDAGGGATQLFQSGAPNAPMCLTCDAITPAAGRAHVHVHTDDGAGVTRHRLVCLPEARARAMLEREGFPNGMAPLESADTEPPTEPN